MINYTIKNTNSFFKKDFGLYLYIMIKVVIIGGGNLATHLATTFQHTDEVNLIQVYNRSLASISHFSSFCAVTDLMSEIMTADVYICAVSDSAITDVQEKMMPSTGIFVHTSGAVSIDVLKGDHIGVFYPLQSFTKGKVVNFKSIPICIEAKNNADILLLKKLASAISDQVYKINSEQRKMLHIAAVFVNNFVNHLYKIGEDICVENEIPFEILQPIIEETAKKIKEISPTEAQTGPAKRADINTLALHEKELDMNKLTIYKLLTNAILKNR